MIDPQVVDVMIPLEKFPVVSHNTLLKEVLESMVSKHIGIACVVSDDNQLLAVFTDGDLRRMLLNVQKPFSAFFVDDILDHSTFDPSTVKPDHMLSHALELMENKQIWDLPVVNNDGKLKGLLHLHSALSLVLKNF